MNLKAYFYFFSKNSQPSLKWRFECEILYILTNFLFISNLIFHFVLTIYNFSKSNYVDIFFFFISIQLLTSLSPEHFTLFKDISQFISFLF